ncbi:hypothetical protein IGI04_014932 [Brassica rapa subsp. trilocularis]|uniref:Uncharacterized protein n=1 Tax=Brassica rapa subsp. trilocularis TaxID=1813537 RepID=A0ABQ7MP79_BRACM|nr:hypothetical protein IGI04_014932 [Brassica rapa subsp. trilocularis]
MDDLLRGHRYPESMAASFISNRRSLLSNTEKSHGKVTDPSTISEQPLLVDRRGGIADEA